MAKEGHLAFFVTAYDDIASARADLEAIEQLEKVDLTGTFDAAVGPEYRSG